MSIHKGTTMKLVAHEIIPYEVKAFLDQGFAQFAQDETGDCRAPFCLSLQSADALAGTICGHSCAGALYIKQIFVSAGCRGQGLGLRLMEDAEKLAAERGCTKIWVDTLSYQAPEFYLKAGFVEQGRIKDFQGASDRIFYCKDLTLEKTDG